jgi:hypothetical protein
VSYSGGMVCCPGGMAGCSEDMASYFAGRTGSIAGRMGSIEGRTDSLEGTRAHYCLEACRVGGHLAGEDLQEAHRRMQGVEVVVYYLLDGSIGA